MREKEIIAEWLCSIQQKMDVSWAELARRANIKAATTLSRAVDMNHHSIMSVKNLEAIAQAAGMPSILDFLIYQSSMANDQKEHINQFLEKFSNTTSEQKKISKKIKLFDKILEDISL